MMFEQNDEWLSTKFINFTPNVREKYLKVIFRPLRDFAPSDSSILFKVDSRGSLLRGTLEVKSTAINFTTTCYAHEVYDLAEKAKKDMVWQIETWKKSRYMNMAI